MKIKYSFIIPTLNEGKYIGKCLSSIKKMRRKDAEIIIVDSYSKDKTVKTARRYGAKVFYEGRKGPAIARNTGAKHAKGDIFVFPDADVIFEKDFLTKLDKEFERNIAGGVFNLYPYDGNGFVRFNGLLINKFVNFMIAIGMPVTNGSCFVYRKKLFRKVHGFNPKFMTNEDHDLAARISKVGHIVFFRNIRVNFSSRRLQKWGLLKSIKMYGKSTYLFFFKRTYIRTGYWS